MRRQAFIYNQKEAMETISPTTGFESICDNGVVLMTKLRK